MEIDERAHSNTYSRRYNEKWSSFNISTTLRLKKINSLIPSEKNLLELSVIHKMPWWDRNKVILADCVESPLKFFKEHPSKKFDFNEKFPFKDNSFEVIVAVEVFEHLYNNKFFLNECKRILKPDGILVGSVPNEYHLFKRIKILFGVDIFGCGEHLRQFNYASLQRILKNSFEKIRIHGYGPGVIYPSLLSSNLIFRCKK